MQAACLAMALKYPTFTGNATARASKARGSYWDIQPMTLANMRSIGVRSLAITCGALTCHHEANLDVSEFADQVTVPSFGPRMVCTVCGAIGADARPNWREQAPPCLFGGPRQ